MATIVKTVMTGGGGDFTSLSAALTALVQDLTLITPTVNDVDGATTIALDIVCSGTTADTTTTNTTIAGWTTDAMHRLRIRGASTITAAWDTTKWRLSNAVAASGSLLVNQIINLDLLDVQIENTGTLDLGPHYLRTNDFAWDIRIDRAFFRMTGTTGTPSNVVGFVGNSFTGAFKLRMRNFVSVCAGAVTQNMNIPGSTTSNVYVYNGTVVNFSTGDVYSFAHTTGGITRNKNVLCQGAGTTNYVVQNTNATTKTTVLTQDATGSAGLTAKTVAFVNPSGYDFHQLSSDPSVAHGTNLAADADQPFSDDINAATRGATWDIGADQFVSGGGISKVASQINARLKGSPLVNRRLGA